MTDPVRGSTSSPALAAAALRFVAPVETHGVLDSSRRAVFQGARAATRKRVIRAGEIEIEDSEAGPRAVRRVERGPAVHVLLRAGREAAGTVRRPVRRPAGLAVADDEGKVRATFGLFSDGSASMAMVDRNGKVRAKFGLGTEGSPTLALRNKDGELGFVYSLAQQGAPTISLQDEDGKVRARLGLAAEGAPIIRLLNSDGELRAIMGLTGDGSPVLQFLDSGGAPAWTAGPPERRGGVHLRGGGVLGAGLTSRVGMVGRGVRRPVDPPRGARDRSGRARPPDRRAAPAPAPLGALEVDDEGPPWARRPRSASPGAGRRERARRRAPARGGSSRSCPRRARSASRCSRRCRHPRRAASRSRSSPIPLETAYRVPGVPFVVVLDELGSSGRRGP